MNIEPAVVAASTYEAAKLGHTTVNICGMISNSASMALTFHSAHSTGLSVTLHCSTAEARAFAAELIRHADITDAAQAAKASAPAELPAA